MENGSPSKTRQERKKGQTPGREPASKPFEAVPAEGNELDQLLSSAGSTQQQSAMLKRLDRPQRQLIVSQIGRVQGNRHVQRLIEKTELPRDGQRSPVKLTQPGSGQHISRREATYLERRAWLAFFDHYLPRRFLNNYMDDTGAEITLTEREMADCNPIVDIRRMRNNSFQTELGRLQAAGGGNASLSGPGYGGAQTNGTLGNFTINWSGELAVSASGSWRFEGTMNFYDYWDFDPRPFGSGSGRPAFAEVRVRAAAYGLPGRPFHIRSVDAPVIQDNAHSGASWSGGRPTVVTGPMVRAASDVGAGTDVGTGADISGGPDIMDVGGVAGSDVGANAAEDVNP